MSSSTPVGRRRAPLRNARVRTKLPALTLVGVLCTGAVAGVGLHGLGRLDSGADDLSSVASTLEDIANLRDGQGDMRVGVYRLATAGGDLTDASADVAAADQAVDAALTGLTTDAAAAGDAGTAADLRAFTEALADWRAVRDQQLVPVARTGGTAAALAVVTGPLAKANRRWPRRWTTSSPGWRAGWSPTGQPPRAPTRAAAPGWSSSSCWARPCWWRWPSG